MNNRTVICAILTCFLFVTGCTANPPGGQSPDSSPDTSPEAVTSASIVNNAKEFETVLGSNGTWIICLVKDITIDKDLSLDGTFFNGKKDEQGNDIVQRKIALYEQDAARNITSRYTLTVPKLTINSPKASIQHGTFKGDLYVAAEGFQLVDTIVEGNVYFTTPEAESSFVADEKSTITGKREAVQPG